MNRIFGLITLIMILLGCNQNGYIFEDELVIKFPIKVQFNELENNRKTLLYNPEREELFELKYDNIKKIIIRDKLFNGDFSISLLYGDDGMSNKVDNNIFEFYSIVIWPKDEKDYENLRSNFTKSFSDLMPILEEHYVLFVDLNNKILYRFNHNLNSLFIKDLSSEY
jgi:hypothetical protein